MLRTLLILITSLFLYITPIYNQCNIPGFLDDIENNPALSDYFDGLYGTGDALGKLKYERGFKAWEGLINWEVLRSNPVDLTTVGNYLTRTNRKIINRKFLQNQKNQSKEFLFSHDPFSPGNDEYFAREVNRLIDNGIQDFQQVGDLWKAVW